MDRRKFICGLSLGTTAVLRAARAPAPRQVYRIGMLSVGSSAADMTGPQPRATSINAFLSGLREGGEDPVGQRIVQSLGHPGGNFTGLSNQSVELTAKRLELLKELVPGVAPVAILWDPTSLSNLREMKVKRYLGPPVEFTEWEQKIHKFARLRAPTGSHGLHEPISTAES